MKSDPRITAYINAAAPFAKPILKELRARIHELVPGVEEDIKWGFPSFMYNGKIFFGMSAFKAHAGCGFWHPLMRKGKSPEGISEWRIESVDELPSRSEFAKLARKAKKLEDDGVKRPARPKPDPNRTVTVPRDLAARLAKNAKARAAFGGFSYSKRKEYVTWITGAKREETRAKRLDTTIEQLAEGKSLMWKYEEKKK